jgi:hypothetical protein
VDLPRQARLRHLGELSVTQRHPVWAEDRYQPGDGEADQDHVLDYSHADLCPRGNADADDSMIRQTPVAISTDAHGLVGRAPKTARTDGPSTTTSATVPMT